MPDISGVSYNCVRQYLEIKMLPMLRLFVLSLLLTGGIFIGQAQCALPTSKLISAPLISPAQAWQYYQGQPNPTARTSSAAAWTVTPPEIKALARALGAERVSETGITQITQAEYAQRVYDYVRNNIATEFRFGLGKGARGALIDQSGTPFDQAELMGSLLREGGVSATYKVGTMQMSAQQAGSWTGVVKSFTAEVNGQQSVVVDARALCQFLADGGIPAELTVSGAAAASCDSLAGDFAASDTITVGHILVEAAGRMYDPAFKRLVFRAGMDLGVATGCGTTCGQDAVATALHDVNAPAETGLVSGQPYFRNVNEAGLNSRLIATAQNVENYIKTNAPNSTIEDVIGGSKINIKFEPYSDSDLRSRFVEQYSWSGMIPDVFRSTISILVKNGQTLRIFGDELSGQRMWFYEGEIITDYANLTSAFGGVCAFTQCRISIDVNHPYAASGGNYADENVVFDFKDDDSFGIAPPDFFAIFTSWGNSTSSTESHFASVQRARPIGGIIHAYFPSTTLTDACVSNCGSELPTIAATALKAQTEAGEFVDQIAHGQTTRHHAIGVVATPCCGNFRPLSNMSLHSSVSANSHQADAGARWENFEIATTLSAMLEGSVLQQKADSWEQASASGLLVLANRSGRKLINVSNAAMSQSFLQSLDGYGGPLRARLQARQAEGYSFILPSSSEAGTFPVAGGSVIVRVGGSYLYRDGGGAGALALLFNGSLKGGAPTYPADPAQAAMNTVHDAATSKSQKITGSGDLASGATHVESVDLLVGAGEFPLSLPFTRFYNSENGGYEAFGDNWWTYEGADADSPLHLPGGWTHSYSYSARVASSLEGALGEQGGLGASSLVAGVYTLLDMGADAFERRLTSTFVANWIGDQVNGNSVIVSKPASSELFLRLPTGTFAAPLGSQARLTQTGVRAGPVFLGSRLFYDYGNIRLAYTLPDASIIRFDPAESQTASSRTVWSRVFKPIDWVFPDGISVKFEYMEDDYNNSKKYILEKVKNSLGRYISISHDVFTFRNDALGLNQRAWRIKQVKDDADRMVSYAATQCAASKVFACGEVSVTSTESQVIRYSYAYGENSPEQISPTRNQYRIRSIYSPSSSTNPIQYMTYDDVIHIKSTKDRNSRVVRYLIGSVTGTENWRRSEMISPRQDVAEVAATIFDDRSNPTVAINPLGLKTYNTYDRMGRLLRSEKPEHNVQEWNYDLRGNVLYTCFISKERAGENCDGTKGDLIHAASYWELPSVWLCANLVICNKVKTQTDPMWGVTNYEWDWDFDQNTGTGQLKRIVQPADIDGTRPQVDFGYEFFTGIDSANFSLLKTKIEKIATNKSVLTKYEYNLTNKFTPLSVKIDDGGLNLTSILSFDFAGNLISVDKPREDVNDIYDYIWDKNRRLTYAFEPSPEGSGQGVRAATYYRYDPDGNLDQVAQGAATAIIPSAFTARLTTAYGYDGVGNRISAISPAGTTEYSYDADDRPSCTAVRMNPAAGVGLVGACQLSDAGELGPDRVTQIVYDAAGQVTDVLRPLGAERVLTWSHATYSDNGQRATVQDANHNLTTFTYDGFDRLIRQDFPAKKPLLKADFETYDYDPNGNRVEYQKRDTQKFTFEYDALDRQTIKHAPEPGGVKDVYTDYDLLGRVVSARFQNRLGAGVTLEYDKAGRRTKETTNDLTVASDYYADGQRKRVTWPGGIFVEYDYDAAGRVKAIREPGGGLAADQLVGFGYDSMGRREATQIVEGRVHSTYRYNAAGQQDLLRYDGLSGGDAIWEEMTYNAAGQLETAKQYNEALVWKGQPTTTTDYTANELNQDAAIATLEGGYDDNGNLTFDGTRHFHYDSENRLDTVSGVSNLAITYDPLGRIQATVAAGTATRFLYDGDALVGEYSDAGVAVRRYVHGGGVDEPLVWYEGAGTSNRHWLMADRQGSIVADAPITGATKFYTYGPYGEAQSWSDSRFRYTGQIALQEAELYHYKARVYDPKRGWFLQTDPVGYQDDLNLYAYVGNDPINHSDPTGTVCWGQSSGYCDRASAYSQMNREFGSKTGYFDAVSRMTANLGSLDLPGVGWLANMGGAERSYLNNLSAGILNFNRGQAQKLRSGEISGGRSDITERLVSDEQGYIQGSLSGLKSSNPSLYDSVIGAMNANANPTGLNAFLLGLTAGSTMSAAAATRSDLGRDINYGNTGDRNAMGNNMGKAADADVKWKNSLYIMNY